MWSERVAALTGLLHDRRQTSGWGKHAFGSDLCANALDRRDPLRARPSKGHRRMGRSRVPYWRSGRTDRQSSGGGWYGRARGQRRRGQETAQFLLDLAPDAPAAMFVAKVSNGRAQESITASHHGPVAPRRSIGRAVRAAGPNTGTVQPCFDVVWLTPCVPTVRLIPCGEESSYATPRAIECVRFDRGPRCSPAPSSR